MAEVMNDTRSPGLGLTRPVRVLIVDDILLTRLGAGEILRRSTWMEWVRCCGDIDEAAAQLRVERTDVVLVNATTIDLEQAMQELGSVPGVALVAFGVAEHADDMLRCVQLGVAGFVLRSAPVETMLEVLARVGAGETQCPPEAVPYLLRHVAGESAGRWPALTARECQILELIETGCSNKDIALRLGIKAHTVKNHLHHVYDKLQVSTRGEAAAKARAGRDGGSWRRGSGR